MKNKNQKKNKFKPFLIAFFLVISIILLSPFSLFTNKSFISDYIVGAPYEVVLVDGNPPERAEHGLIVTVVPLVKVSAGSHMLTLQEKDMNLKNINAPIDNFMITVGARKRYRLNRVNGQPILQLENKR